MWTYDRETTSKSRLSYVLQVRMYKGRWDNPQESEETWATRAGFPFRKHPLLSAHVTLCEPRHLRIFRSALRRFRNPTFWRLEIRSRRGHTSSFFHLFYFSYSVQFYQFLFLVFCVFLSGTAVQQLFLKCRSSVALSARPRATL